MTYIVYSYVDAYRSDATKELGRVEATYQDEAVKRYLATLNPLVRPNYSDCYAKAITD